ncbi:hypothetical protein LTR53_012324 [Teratosphaeriaceae sp. CCFEE 6253]|nr:hypothetical protein LTR53_012324 [Teratosphaeriaceae sp. CCFEE 6253]
MPIYVDDDTGLECVPPQHRRDYAAVRLLVVDPATFVVIAAMMRLISPGSTRRLALYARFTKVPTIDISFDDRPVRTVETTAVEAHRVGIPASMGGDKRSSKSGFSSSRALRAATAVVPGHRSASSGVQRSRGFDVLQTGADEPTAEEPTAVNHVQQVATNRNDSAAQEAKNAYPYSHERPSTLEPEESEGDEGGWTVVGGRAASRLPGPKQIAQTDVGNSKEPWLENEWRLHNPAMNKSRPAPRSAYTKRDKTSNYTHQHGLKTASGTLHSDQAAGNLLWHLDKQEHSGRKVPDSDPRVTFENGKRYLTKGRYFLVVKATEKTVTECPIYTNGDTGLQHVGLAKRKEFFSLRPDDVSVENFEKMNQVPETKFYSVGWVVTGSNGKRVRKLRPTMVVHFARPRTRPIDLDEVQLVGALAQDEVEEVCAKASKRSR